LKESGKAYNRVVIKVGSSLFCSEKAGLDRELLGNIVREVCGLLDAGKEVVIVSSGAIALGMLKLGFSLRPKELSYLQAAAATGQSILMQSYFSLFEKHGKHCSQVLLTWDDFNDRKRYLNAKNTLKALLKLKSVPIINENDTVSTDEIKFGDNDQLSARVASLISADLLIMLSDVDGLLDKDKKIIGVVSKIDNYIRSLACPTAKKTCVGGMITKIEAASIASSSGIPCVIANGKSIGIIAQASKDPFAFGAWTVFVPEKGCLAERKRWIAFGSKAKGTIVIDDGAAVALKRRKSLLSVGVVNVIGEFASGDIALVTNAKGVEICRGKVSVSSHQLNKIKGSRSEKEVIHCDNIVLV